MIAAGADAALNVSEIFGPTFQGEGPNLGRRAGFIRLAGCHLSCSWCDTPYTWDETRFTLHHESMTAADLLSLVLAYGVDLVVVTGGEPLLQRPGLRALVRLLTSAGLEVEIETSGTIVPDPEVVAAVSAFNVSPKLANSGLSLHRRIKPSALNVLRESGKAVFKFVVTDVSDLDEITALVERYALAPIWVMPEGTTAEQILARTRLLADPVIARGWHLTTRLHILAWGDQRGR